VLTGVIMTFLVALLFDAVLVAIGRVIMPWSHLAKQLTQAGA
jgi:osmoprotectant transport system permease protein